MSEIPGYSSGQFGPDNKEITFTIENDTNLDRTEVVGVMALFPDGADGILPEDIGNYYMYLEGGRETLGFGLGNSYQTNYTYNTTLPWVGPLNAVTAGSGNIKPGSCTLSYVFYGYGPTSWPTGSLRSGKISLVDTPINGTTGQFIHPGIVSSSINYTTGAISIQFTSNYGPSGDLPIRLTYKFNTPTKYPTQWTILRTWPTGRVRQAKAWIGQASGVGMFIPKKNQSIITTPTSTQTIEYTRGYLRIGYDPAVNLNLPTYTVHAALATALNTGSGSYLSSEVQDVQGNPYYSSLLANAFEENVIEDPANNGGKGWMRVIQRRGYHQPFVGGSNLAVSTRDLFSLTSYLYVPHNSRIMDVETRLGNDYQGGDPVEHSMTENLGTGNGAQTAFSAVMTHMFPSGDGKQGHLRLGRVKVYVGSTLVAWDRRGNGILQPQNGYAVTGGVDYSTGSVSVTFTTPPAAGVVVSCNYKTYYLRIGTASGTQTLNYTLPSKASQYSIHVRVGGGASAIYEGWDGGTYYGFDDSVIVPYNYTTVQTTQVVASPLPGTTTGTLQTNIVPGTVVLFAHATADGASSILFCRDNGYGALVGRGITSGTIDYVTGAVSIVWSSTPAVGLNLYAKYGRTTSARPISGTAKYSTRALTVTTSQAVPANTPVFVSYIRNTLAVPHDPNKHPIGSAGFKRWSLFLDGTKFTDHMCEGGPAYGVIDGGTTARFSVIINSGVTNGGGTDPWAHEYLHDGASVARTYFMYAGSGASSAENNTWAAKKIHTIQTIPTLAAYNNTRAYGLLEGALNFITPEQTFDWTEMTKRNFSEDIARRPSLLTVPYPNPWIASGGGNGYFLGYALNKSNEFSAVDAWNQGVPKGSGVGAAGNAEGVRNHLKWQENVYTGVNQGGAPRALHDSSIYFLYSQAWQGVRYMYHAALFNVVRPGTMLWNFAGRSRWNDRAFQNYIPTSPAAGALITSTPRNDASYETNSLEYLGRGWKYGWSNGTVSVTNGSNVVYFSSFANEPTNQSILQNWNLISPTYANGGSYRSPVGTTQVDGKRRITFAGSIETYTVTNVYYDNTSNRWAAQLDRNAIVTTNATAQFCMLTDPTPGQDIVPQRNDPRSWPELRLACNVYLLQHGIEGESSSHQATFCVFDTWNCTGSWALWDVARHTAEWNMISMKEYVSKVFRQDQMRTSAWTHRSVLTGYSLVKDLSGKPGFSFLSDPDYGDAAFRLKEWLQIRWTQWCSNGAKGQMDPNNTIAVNGKQKFADIRATSSSDKADWFSMSLIGSPNPAYGGAGFFNSVSGRWEGPTEAQVRFDDDGFTYVSVWELGYLTPWMAATYREFRFDNTPMDMPERGETSVPFSQIVERIFNGYATLLIDYGWITQQMNFSVRGAPGMFAASTFGNPAFPELTEKWGLIINPTVGTPINFVVANANDPGKIRPIYEPVQWPSTDINNFAAQVYWLRGASKTLSQGLTEDIDRLGWPLPNRGGYTSFELVNPSWQTGWHSPGIAFQGDPIIPANQTNPQVIGEIHARIRPNQHPEGFVLEGTESLTHKGTALSWSTLPFLMMVARFHSSAQRRAQAGEILNRAIWQARAMSLIKSTYDQPNSSEFNKGGPIEFNYFAGPITGDFPYSTDTGSQPIDRWWNTSYVNRRKIASGTSHEAHIAGQDVFSIDLSLYGVDDRVLQTSGTDIRVVRQLADGSYQVCSSILRTSPTGSWTLFVVAPVGISANQPIPSASNASEAWYIYYGSAQGTAAGWSNTDSIDGPYISDSNTRVLWNQDGNFATDAGPNNWPVVTFAGTEPDYVSGPFGGAIGLDYANGDVAYSFEASQVVREGSPFNVGGNFTFDFQFYVPVNKFETDQAFNYGLFSVADTGIYSAISYLEGPTKRLVATLTLGTTGTGFTISSVTADGPVRSVVGTGNNVLTTFSSNIGANRIPGTVAVTTSTGSIIGIDNGSGTITGTGIAAGSTIDYTTGAITIVTSSPVAMGVVVVAYSTNTTSRWSLSGWNHMSVSFNGSRVLLAVNGNQIGTVAAAGVIQSIPAASITGISLGALFTPAEFFQARSVVRIAEFRISSNDRGVLRKLGNKLETSLLAEESLLATASSTASVTGTLAGVSSFANAAGGFMATAATTVALPVALDIITGQGIQSIAAADMNVAATKNTTATSDLCVQVSNLSSSAPVAMNMAAVFQFLTTGLGTVSIIVNVSIPVAAAIQVPASFTNAASGIIGNLVSYSVGVDAAIIEANNNPTVLLGVVASVVKLDQILTAQVQGAVASNQIYALPVAGSIAIPQVATISGQPITAVMAVQVTQTLLQSVGGTLAGSMVDSPVLAPVSALVGGLGSTSAAVALDILGTTQERSLTNSASMAMQVTAPPTNQDVSGSVAAPKLVQSGSVLAAIQVAQEITHPVAATMQVNNVSFFTPAALAVSVIDNILTSPVSGLLATPLNSTNSVNCSLVLSNQVSLPAALTISGDGSGISIPVDCALSKNYEVTQEVVGDVVPTNLVELPVTVSLADIGSTSLDVEAHISAATIQVIISGQGVVATSANSFVDVGGSMATTKFELAVVRGLIVLPLNQSLNASGVDTTTTQGS